MAETVVVVVSDLHASSAAGDDAETWLTGSTPRTPVDHPIIGLRAYLEKYEISPDLLLVGGDICNQADEGALTQAWSDLHALVQTVGGRLIATVGNHDVDSRNKNSLMDPRGHLYDLDPEFPVPGDENARDSFWARNYAIIDAPTTGQDLPAWRVITLNSAAFHGYTSNHGKELEFGRVSLRTLKRLRTELEARKKSGLTLLLVHHHPFQLPTVDQSDESRLVGAESLVQLLEDQSPCVLVHGHKHRAFIHFSGGGGSNLWVFSAGSMSAFPYGQNAAQGTENQAYILTFRDPQDYVELDLVVAVRFQALSWTQEIGWRQSTATENMLTLPGRGGFRWVLQNPRNIASKIAAAMDREEQTRIEHPELAAIEPRIAYLAPTGIARLKKALGDFDCDLEMSNDGTISKIVQKVRVEPSDQRRPEESDSRD